MKKLLFLILFIPILVSAQDFTGEIIYEIKIIPKSDTANLKKIMELKNGTVLSYLLTSKQYKSTYSKEGRYKYSYTYDPKTRRLYDDFSHKPYMTYRDSRKSLIQYYGAEVYKDSTATILDHDCYLMESKSQQGTTRAYYAKNLKVNYANYEGHNAGNWYEKLKMVDGAIPLRTITEHETYTEVIQAVKIVERKVSDKEFKPVQKKPVVASFSVLDQPAEVLTTSPDQAKCYQDKVNAMSNEDGEEYTSMIVFLLTSKGEVRYVAPYGRNDDYYVTAADIINNCGFDFKPGKIAGKPVDSQVFFPVNFLK